MDIMEAMDVKIRVILYIKKKHIYLKFNKMSYCSMLNLKVFSIVFWLFFYAGRHLFLVEFFTFAEISANGEHWPGLVYYKETSNSPSTPHNTTLYSVYIVPIL